MKYFKRKQVARLTFYGGDDLLKNDATASTTISGGITRSMEFYVNDLYNTEFSQNAKMVIENVSLYKTPSNSLIKI